MFAGASAVRKAPSRGVSLQVSEPRTTPPSLSTNMSSIQDNLPDLCSFLRRLSSSTDFSYLFKEPGVVLALFRSLNDSERVTVLRLLDLPEAVRWEPFLIWNRGDRKRTLQVLNTLRAFRILRLCHNPKTDEAQSSCRRSLRGTTPSEVSSVSSPASSPAPSSVLSTSPSKRAGGGPSDYLRASVGDAASATGSVAGSTTGGCSSYVAGLSPPSTTGRSAVSLSAVDIRYQLDPIFRNTLRQALNHGITGILGIRTKPPKHFPTKETLHEFFGQQWRGLFDALLGEKPKSTIGNKRRRESMSHSDSSDSSPLGTVTASASHPSSTAPLLVNGSADLSAVLKQLQLLGPKSPSSLSAAGAINNQQTGWPGSSRVSGIISFRPAFPLTSNLFQWLLKDVQSQLLSLCIAYLKGVHYSMLPVAETRQSINTDAPLAPETATRQMLEVLVLLFSLSELPIGQPCAIGALTDAQKRFLQFGTAIGLLWMYKSTGSKHFFTTPLAKLLQTQNQEVAYLIPAVSHLAALVQAAPLGFPTGCVHSTQSDTEARSGALQDVLTLPPELYHPAYVECGGHLSQSCVGLSTFRSSASSPLEVNGHAPCAVRRKTGAAVEQCTDPQAYAKSAIGTLHTGIVVESNFKVFAYTASPLLITVVSHLCEIRIITPCLVVGLLSRDSILEAFKHGVTAEQVIQFFSTHAHPLIYTKGHREGKSLLPENVTAQLRIWQDERRRVRMQRACVFEFSKEADLELFPAAVTRAQAGWLLVHTRTPGTSNGQSKEFQKWKEEVIQQMRSRPQAADSSSAAAPVLAIHARYKDDMTTFLRSTMRNLKR